MSGFLIGLFTLLLVGVSAFVVLLILMQRSSANAGLGASLGAGAAESTFGGETSNVLSRMTIYAIIAFFAISFGLYLTYMAGSDEHLESLPLPAVAGEEEIFTPGSLTDIEDITQLED